MSNQCSTDQAPPKECGETMKTGTREGQQRCLDTINDDEVTVSQTTSAPADGKLSPLK